MTAATEHDRLRALREACDLSQGAVAEAAAIDRANYVNMEAGRRSVPRAYDGIEALAAAFGLTAGALVTYLRGEVTLEKTKLRRGAK